MEERRSVDPQYSNKTTIFDDVDDKSVTELKAIDLKPYFDSGKIKFAFD